MTILPHEGDLSAWQRARALLQALLDAIKDWRADDDVCLPDWWKPKQLESGKGGSDV